MAAAARWTSSWEVRRGSDRGVGGVDVDDAWNREEGGEIGRVRGEVEKERLVAGVTKHSLHGTPER